MLKYFSYSDTIVLFWDKNIDGVSKYEIILDNIQIGESIKTFYRINGLKGNTEYNVSVTALCVKDKKIPVGDIKCKTSSKKRDLDVSAYPYYAVGDGKTLNTSALQWAIDDCGKDKRVVIPKGIFLTGALRLYPNTEIYIEKGGVLKGSEKAIDYLPKIDSRFEGIERQCLSSLLNIGYTDHERQAEEYNVIIRGDGEIVGGGENLLFDVLGIDGETEDKRSKLKRYQDHLYETDDERYRERGRLINISNAKNVIIDGLTLGFAPSWNVHIIYSENVITCGCKIMSHGVWNGDGWDPDSSENCAVFDCEFDTGDDCIAIKSGKNPEGNIIDKPTRNIDIFSCRIKKGKSHGVAIGSEVSGGINGVKIWDCDFSNSFFGIHIKTTAKRGGYIKNVQVKDSKISRVMIREVGYNDDGDGCSELTEISGIKFKNIKIEYNSGDPNFGKEADSYVYINGFDKDEKKVNAIEFNDIEINNKENLKEYDVKNCSDVFFNGKKIK